MIHTYRSILNIVGAVILLFISLQANAGKKIRVLFIGNSYVYVNDLPKLVADVAASAGDTVIYDSNAPGGQTLQQHCTDAVTLSKIQAGNWDYVVLQEQSQRPSFPIGQVETDVFPYAKKLDSLVHHYNSCGKTIFYMTWGRKNGDASNCAVWPPVCTYTGMDDLLRERYMTMADDNDAIVSPVAAVWRYVRQNHPAIELYQTDESHPSAEGSYAAACCFYTALFKKDPEQISFNSTIAAADAAKLRTAAKKVAFDSLSTWHIGQYGAWADFTHTISGSQVSFTNTSTNAVSYTWAFGDGQTSTQTNPAHTYPAVSIYTVKLTATDANACTNVLYQSVNLYPTGIGNANFSGKDIHMAPNPAHSILAVYSPFFQQNICNIIILNSTGQKVLEQKSKANSEQLIDITGLSSGMYIIDVTEISGSIYHETFIKN